LTEINKNDKQKENTMTTTTNNDNDNGNGTIITAQLNNTWLNNGQDIIISNGVTQLENGLEKVYNRTHDKHISVTIYVNYDGPDEVDYAASYREGVDPTPEQIIEDLGDCWAEALEYVSQNYNYGKPSTEALELLIEEARVGVMEDYEEYDNADGEEYEDNIKNTENKYFYVYWTEGELSMCTSRNPPEAEPDFNLIWQGNNLSVMDIHNNAIDSGLTELGNALEWEE